MDDTGKWTFYLSNTVMWKIPPDVMEEEGTLLQIIIASSIREHTDHTME